MPELNPNLDLVGTGFAAFLAPPGPEVIRFTVGQPDFDTPLPIVDAAKASLDRGETAYTRPQGSETLCQAVSDHLMQFQIDVKPDDVVVAPGCKQALLYGMMAAIGAGDEVLLLSPAWPSYDGMVRLAGGIPVHVPVKRENYHPDLAALEAHITPKTKVIIINSPNNPTGAVYTREETKAIVEMAVKHDLWILDDMIYSTLVWTDEGYTSPCEFEGGAERTITIGGWSKGWAMTGWRLGWIAASTRVMEGVKKINVSAATHVPTFLMPAAETALRLTEEVEMMADSFRIRRTVAHEAFSSLPGVNVPEPEGAFYILCDITGTGMTDMEFATRALKEAKVQVIPGSLMKGGEGLIRISYATSLDNIHEGIRRLKEWLLQRT
ncbi:MAG TPA: pyridoxal phosphate-dependent aminotransferase [Poseidonia sp.]|nr:pyridoxal phosphate-dependent aminotransferase [Poseidonia sp.]